VTGWMSPGAQEHLASDALGAYSALLAGPVSEGAFLGMRRNGRLDSLSKLVPRHP
jgi:hypothetical protein